MKTINPLVFILAGSCMAGSAAVAQVELEESKIFMELNSTDGDLGIHAKLDGEGWKIVNIINPQGDTIFTVEGKSVMLDLGLTEIFFESEEPSLAELSFAELQELFPEGEYKFEGLTLEDGEIVGSGELTANLPCPPLVNNPDNNEWLGEEDLVIRWEHQPGTFNPDTDVCSGPADVEITSFQVIVEFETEDEEILRVYSVDMPPDAGELPVPVAFLKEGVDLEADFKLEVIAVEESGNKTITEVAFHVTDEELPSPAFTLPVLGRTAALGGDAPPGFMAAGAAIAGTMDFEDEFSPDDSLVITGEIVPADAHLNQPADLFVVSKYSTPEGETRAFYRNIDGEFVPWSGELEDLLPLREAQALDALETLEIHEGSLPAGEYEFYFGYMVGTGPLIYGEEPLAIVVED